MSQSYDLYKIFRQYQDEHDGVEAELHAVVEWAVKCNLMALSKPDPMKEAVASMRNALQKQTKTDPETGRTIRTMLAVTPTDPRQPTLWGHIDEVERSFAHKAFQLRRKQMVGDAVQLSFMVDHWNTRNPEANPIKIDVDFGVDVEEAKAALAAEGDGDEPPPPIQ